GSGWQRPAKTAISTSPAFQPVRAGMRFDFPPSTTNTPTRWRFPASRWHRLIMRALSSSCRRLPRFAAAIAWCSRPRRGRGWGRGSSGARQSRSSCARSTPRTARARYRCARRYGSRGSSGGASEEGGGRKSDRRRQIADSARSHRNSVTRFRRLRMCSMSVKGHASAKLDLRETTAKRGTMRDLQMVRGEASCPCCSGLLDGKFDRRHFVRAVAIGAATVALAPYLALAAEGNYEAMVLSCIDPRMQEPVHKYTVEQNLTGKFSQFVIAGAAIGVVAPAFKDWHQA